MKKLFNVLDRNLKLHQHYLLEASAGTGKTFSIQNIVVRLLIESPPFLEGEDRTAEKEPLLLQNILVVTFTRAATRDLKMRIRSNIEEALFDLQTWQVHRTFSEHMPDYLKGCIEKGEDAVAKACKRLHQALFTFDDASIFTIHSFCARMLRQFALEGDIGLYCLAGDETLSKSEIMSIIRDFFRTGIRIENYSPVQLGILLKEDPAQRKLIRLVQSLHSFPHLASYKKLYLKISEALLSLKRSHSLCSENLISDFKTQAPAYRNHKGAETKIDTLTKAIRFAKLFDQEEWSVREIDRLIQDGLIWLKALDPALLKGAVPKQELLHYPGFTENLCCSLDELVKEAGDFSYIIARLARDCQRHLHRFQREEEKLSHDDMLRKMKEALGKATFSNKVRAHYQAAIIDEFQDTDPLQWQIFSSLFLSDNPPWNGYLYLVGDPKQSIYSFRQADIYTYLEAAKALGEERCFSLSVNYRSQHCLVQALNTLFAQEHFPCFIPLPKQGQSLIYQPVLPAERNKHCQFSDKRGAIHFFAADGQIFKNAKITDLETNVFFPFISQEILRLKKQKNFSFSQFAVLVRDRHQALRLAEHFSQLKIPYMNQRGMSLADSVAHQTFIDLMRAVLHPHERGIMRILLGSPLIGWSYEEVRRMESVEWLLVLMQKLRKTLFEKSFSLFFQEVLQSICQPSGKTILERVLSQEGGREFYRDLRQIADLIIDHQHDEWHGPEGIISFLDNFQVWENNDDARVKRFQDPATDGVKILTLHFSKGLEFDVVFALGLVNRMGMKEELIPVERGGEVCLAPIVEEESHYLHYCEEIDAEKMRQLYVALTRAKMQLYIPIALHLPSEKIKWGEASPIDLFLARLLRAAPIDYVDLYARIKAESGLSFLQFLEHHGKDNFISYSMYQKVLFEEPFIENEEKVHLIPPSAVIVSDRPLWITSFTSLSQQREYTIIENEIFSERAPSDYDCKEKNIQTLPANSETGLLLHKILEKINISDFKKLKDPLDAVPMLKNYLQGTLFAKWEEVIAQMVFHALKTPLTESLGSFCLADLPSSKLYREMSFSFSSDKECMIENIVCKEGVIKGVLDGLFYHQDKYYLLDWKTNWLGNHAKAYHQNALKKAMEENSYFLQAAIYRKATERYLNLVESRPFNECFGGIFYLFLRGMQEGNQGGVWFFL